MSLLLKALRSIPEFDAKRAADEPALRLANVDDGRDKPRASRPAAAPAANERLAEELSRSSYWSIDVAEPAAEEFQAFTELPGLDDSEEMLISQLASASEEAPAAEIDPLERLHSLSQLLRDLETSQPKAEPKSALPSFASSLGPPLPSNRASLLAEKSAVNRAPAAAPNVAQPYRELRDHLFARLTGRTQTTLLVLDAGRAAANPLWLLPLAQCVLEPIDRLSVPSSQPPRVLLVDLLAEGGLTQHLGLEANAATGAAAREPSPWPAIQNTGCPGVDVLSLGKRFGGSIASDELASSWAKTTADYQTIFIIGGAWQAMAADSQHSAALLSVCDGAVLSVHLHATPRALAEAAARDLAARGVNLVGCVVHGQFSAGA